MNMNTIQAKTTRSGWRGADIAIVGALALSLAALGAALHDYYSGVVPSTSSIARLTGAEIQGARPEQVVTPDYLAQVGEALMAAE
jgi:hypothetical protein